MLQGRYDGVMMLSRLQAMSINSKNGKLMQMWLLVKALCNLHDQCAYKPFWNLTFRLVSCTCKNEGPKSRRYEVIALTSHFDFRDLVTWKLSQGH